MFRYIKYLYIFEIYLAGNLSKNYDEADLWNHPMNNLEENLEFNTNIKLCWDIL